MGLKVGNNNVEDVLIGTNPVLKIYRGENIIWQKQQGRLPSQYQEVEYIENTNRQYIDSGVIGRPNIEVKAKAIFTDSANLNNLGLVGSRQTSGGTRFYIISTYSNRWHLGLGGDYTSDTYPKKNILYDIHFSFIEGNFVLYVDNNIILSGNTNIETTYPLYIFGVNNYGTVSRLAPAKLYSLEIIQDNTLVRNFIPCYRKADGEIGLYDLVNDVFYTNQGTGTFSKGNDIN